MGFPRQEYWSGLLFPSPGDLPDPGMEPASLTSPVLAGRLFTTSATYRLTALYRKIGVLVSPVYVSVNYSVETGACVHAKLLQSCRTLRPDVL